MKNTWGILHKIEKDAFINKQNTELTKLNKDKDKFMSILAHDLRNPFNNLLGFSQILVKNLRKYDIDKIEKQVTVINREANKTFNLLQDILLWSRAQSGKIVFNPCCFNFNKVCVSIVEQSISRAQTKNITLTSTVPSQLNLYSDINLLKTVMRNLISNAIKFTNNGGTITIDAKTQENEIVVSVSDTGVGVAKNILPDLFNIAKDNTTKGTNKEDGTGLGLQICKEFIEKMGGEIWVESILGKGSTFYFTIPQ
jgi:signal transduction histidine kinase